MGGQEDTFPNPHNPLLRRLKTVFNSDPSAHSADFLNLIASLTSLNKIFFGPTEEEQAILYAAVRLLLGNTSNDPDNLKEKINSNELFSGENDPVKAFQGKLIETVEALQNYCNTILKEKSKDRPEYNIFDVRKILIALQHYRNNHKDDQGFDLNRALTVTSSALQENNLTKVLSDPYCLENFQGNQGMQS
jgi:hypothetical protein